MGQPSCPLNIDNTINTPDNFARVYTRNHPTHYHRCFTTTHLRGAEQLAPEYCNGPWNDYANCLLGLYARNASLSSIIRTASSEFGTYRLCEQRRFRRACASAQSRQNLRCSLIQAVNQEELSDRKPDPWPLWMAGHAQLKFVMTECSKTQIRLTGLIRWPIKREFDLTFTIIPYK